MALLWLVLRPGTGAAQTTLRGRVIDSEIGHPLAGATVRIRGGSSPLTTDSLGRFEARELRGGDAQVRIELLGYVSADFRVPLPASGDVEQVFALDFTGYELPEIVVRGRVERLMPRYLDFEQRRQRGLGAYLRWDELNQKGYARVGDALRTVRGVRMRCNQETYECYAVMARNPQCQPTWWIDGVEVRSFHENTPIRDVYGIEIYRGPGEVPGDFGGSNAACGVIVMWTKSRPYR
ncbi:MAG: carboxypeptidase regulatory-like domain-containing protein [Gemmatimonadetes bacterium]|nr:carboxypeptidase regulatory-like domain-containing protein [Gemmatimonadota bacterium]